MAVAQKRDTPGSEMEAAPVAGENPLIPNKKLCALYTAMVELRLLEEFLALKRRPKVGSAGGTRGEEGCRVSTAIDLKPGDLTSDGAAGTVMAFLRGAKLPTLLRGRTGGDRATGSSLSSGLPAITGAGNRLHLAMGATLGLKLKQRHLLTVAYVDRGELSLPEWKPILRFAGAHALPTIFVVQGAAAGNRTAARPGQLSLASSACGVPGIPVDAADPVALYRVAQESMLRARAGGGPVLMECIPFQIAGKKSAAADPIATMKQFLLQRKIVSEAWCGEVAARFQNRMKTAGG